MFIMDIININGMEQSYQQLISNMRKVLYDDYDAQIKGKVENVITLLEKVYAEYHNGAYM